MKNLKVYLLIFDLLLGNTIELLIYRPNTFLQIMSCVLTFSFFCILFFIFLLRVYKDNTGKWVRLICTNVWACGVVGCAQSVLIFLANISGDEFLKTLFSLGAVFFIAIFVTAILWIPIGILNFFALTWIFRKK